MSTVGEEGSAALDAANDLVDLLRLAHEAAHRVNERAHSGTFETAREVSQDLHALRQKADTLKREIEEYVTRVESVATPGDEHLSGSSPRLLP